MRPQKILLIGRFREIYEFRAHLEKRGYTVYTAESNESGYEEARARKPDAIIFMHPPYWERVAQFAQKIREEEKMERAKILYLSAEMEGNDQPMLQKYGVRTFTLGPVPTEEILRFLKNEIG